LPLLYGALAVHRGGMGVVPWMLAAWLHFGREVAKDLADVPGDRVLARRTVPILWGEPAARNLARAALWSFVAASVILPAVAGYGRWYFAIAILADAFVIGADRMLAQTMYQGAALRTKLAMPLGVAALVLGRVA